MVKRVTKAEKLEIEMRRIQSEYEALKNLWLEVLSFVTDKNHRKLSGRRNDYLEIVAENEKERQDTFYPIRLPREGEKSIELISDVSYLAHEIWVQILRVKEIALNNNRVIALKEAESIIESIGYLGNRIEPNSLFGIYTRQYSNTRKSLVRSIIKAYCDDLMLIQVSSKSRENDGTKSVPAERRKERLESTKYIAVKPDTLTRMYGKGTDAENVKVIGFDYDYRAKCMVALISYGQKQEWVEASQIRLYDSK